VPPETPLPDDTDFLPLDATPEQEAAHRAKLDLKKQLARENQRLRADRRKDAAHIAELEGKLASGAVDPKLAEQFGELLHRDAVRAALDTFDFTAKGVRSKTVAELLAMTRLDESGALVLIDDESDEALPIDEKLLRELLPSEAINSYTGGGSGSTGPPEAPIRSAARDEDSDLIEKGRRSQAFYESRKADILAAEKRRTR
jgi:hypothetical protein